MTGAPTEMCWDEYLHGVAEAVAKKSKDRSTKVGAVIVGPNHEIICTGYNGFPRGVDDNVAARHERPAKYQWTEHAERNAIYTAARRGIALEGCGMHLTWMPCMDCARGIVQVGIKYVIGVALRLDDPQWVEQFKLTKELFAEAGVIYQLAIH